jgi:hypothetical protein
MLVALSPLFLDINLGLDPALVAAWTVPVIGLAAAGLAFAVGFAVFRRPPSRLPHTLPAGAHEAAPPTPADDPFVHGSRAERRSAYRREGTMVAIQVTDAEGQGPPVAGWVTDRSVGGLCLRLDEAPPPGTYLNVRPREATALVPWTQVEVKSRRQDGNAWEVGCRFVRTPPWSVLLLFG